MTDVPPAPVAPRVSRRGLYIPLLLFGAACLIWTGVWFYAKAKTGAVMDAWIAREARLGRAWSCPSRDISGFPFRIAVTCDKPEFVSTQPGRAGKGTLDSLAVTARVVDPKQIIAVATAPLVWTADAGDSLAIRFGNARASYRGTPSEIEAVSLELDTPTITYTAPGLKPQTLSAAKSELHLRRAPTGEAAVDIALSASGLVSELINSLMRNSDPGALTFSARMTRFHPALPRDWRQTLETWRQQEGEAQIDRLALQKGLIALDLKGALRLDEQRRPQGEIRGTAQGLSALMQAFGVNLGGGGLLGALLGGGAATRQQPAQEKALPIVLRADQGRLFFGPIPGPHLLPLYR